MSENYGIEFTFPSPNESSKNSLQFEILDDLKGTSIDSNTNLELGIFIESVGISYILTRYEHGGIANVLGYESLGKREINILRAKDQTLYLIRYLPPTWIKATAEGVEENLIKPKHLACHDLLLLKVNEVFVFDDLSFQFSGLKEAFSCRSSEEKEIVIEVMPLVENKNVLTNAKYLKQNRERDTKKFLWQGSNTVLKPVTLTFQLSRTGGEDYEWTRNDIRPRLPKAGVKESFELAEASEKAVTLLSRTTMSNVWCALSPNIYGFFIRSVLLSGSRFEGQVVPDPAGTLALATVSTAATFAMQFGLSWYLWANLPFRLHPSANTSESDASAAATLSRIWPAGPDDLEYSVCRTEPVVQVICLALFLFYVLNAVPGLVRDLIIPVWSCSLSSVDADGVTRIRYFRSDPLPDTLLRPLITPFSMETIDRNAIQAFARLRRSNPDDPRFRFFLPLSPRTTPFHWTLDVFHHIPPPRAADGGPGWVPEDWVRRRGKDSFDEQDTRLAYEVREARAFLRRKLAELLPDTFAVDPHDADLQDLAHARAARQLEEALAGPVTSESGPEPANAGERGREAAKIARTAAAGDYLVVLDYCEGFRPREVRRRIGGYGACLLSVVAVVGGVLPQLAAVMMLLICGVQYILWNGVKLVSETRGIEEIILASVAISFINEIDEAMYDHVLPEVYKTAHERDRFRLPRWVPPDEPSPMELDSSSGLWGWLIPGRFYCLPGGWRSLVCCLPFFRHSAPKATGEELPTSPASHREGSIQERTESLAAARRRERESARMILAPTLRKTLHRTAVVVKGLRLDGSPTFLAAATTAQDKEVVVLPLRQGLDTLTVNVSLAGHPAGAKEVVLGNLTHQNGVPNHVEVPLELPGELGGRLHLALIVRSERHGSQKREAQSARGLNGSEGSGPVAVGGN